MPEDRATRGGLLFGYFLLATQEKVTRSPAGRVKALHFTTSNEKIKMDSRLRGNDGKKEGPGFRLSPE